MINSHCTSRGELLTWAISCRDIRISSIILHDGRAVKINLTKLENILSSTSLSVSVLMVNYDLPGNLVSLILSSGSDQWCQITQALVHICVHGGSHSHAWAWLKQWTALLKGLIHELFQCCHTPPAIFPWKWHKRNAALSQGERLFHLSQISQAPGWDCILGHVMIGRQGWSEKGEYMPENAATLWEKTSGHHLRGVTPFVACTFCIVPFWKKIISLLVFHGSMSKLI